MKHSNSGRAILFMLKIGILIRLTNNSPLSVLIAHAMLSVISIDVVMKDVKLSLLWYEIVIFRLLANHMYYSNFRMLSTPSKGVIVT